MKSYYMLSDIVSESSGSSCITSYWISCHYFPTGFCHVSFICKLMMVPNLLDYRIGILHYLFCTYWGVGVEIWSPIMHWNTQIFLSLPECKSIVDSASYIYDMFKGLFPKPKVCICLFFNCLKNLIFNFNQYYFTYCRDSNLCDLQQPKYCSVQFCSCVWGVSLWSS